MALTITDNLPLVSLQGNPMKVKIHTDNLFDGINRRPFYTIILNVYSSTNTLLRTLSEEPNNSGDAWFNLSEIFASLKPTITHPIANETPVVLDSTASQQFYFKLAEGYGVPYVEQAESTTSSNYYVIPGGLPDWYLKSLANGNTTFYEQLLNQNIWLTNQPDIKNVYADQPEQLHYFSVSSSNQTASLKVKRLSNLGVETTATLWTGTINAYSHYVFKSSPAFCAIASTVKYTLYLEVGSTKITDDAVFVIDSVKPENTRYVLFRNSLGGFDCVALTGKMVTELETSTLDFVTPEISKIREALVPGQERASAIKYLTGTIGWKTPDELAWLSELLHSEDRRLVVNTTDLETIIIGAERRKIGDDTFAPKTFNIEAVIGVTDFFFLS